MLKTITTLLILIVSVNLNAQVFAFGVKAGANLNKINGKAFNQKFEYGYHVGLITQVKLLKKLTLQPEVHLSQINNTVDSNFNAVYNSINNPNYRKNIDLKYLAIPLVANYNLGKAVALQAGVQYGVLLNSNKSLQQNGEAAFKSGDFAALAGVQIKVWKVLLSGRYIIGLQNINDINDSNSWRSQTAQFSVGFMF